MAGGKKHRIRLESEIQRYFRNDNGVTTHFDYRIRMNSAKNTVVLNLLTFNPVHDDFLLFHKVSGKSAIDCLEKMLKYIRQDDIAKTEYSYTVSWRPKGSNEEMHLSYFRAKTKEAVIEKFLHEKKAEDYE